MLNLDAARRSETIRLRTLSVFLEALRRVWRLRGRLFEVMALPGVAIMVLWVVRWKTDIDSNAATAWFLWALDWVALGFGAVACHRLVLLGPDAEPTWGANGRNQREWLFLGDGVLVGLSTVAVFFVATNLVIQVLNFSSTATTSENPRIFAGFLVVGWLAAAYVLARLSLLLPARAVDKPIGMRQTWRLSRGNGGRLTLLIAVFPRLVAAGESLLAERLSQADGTVVWVIVFLLFMPIEVALLSVCYERLFVQIDDTI
jgi:hypothetical protein